MREDALLVTLGVAQDSGHPQVGCEGACCAAAWADPSRRHLPVALGVWAGSRRWLIEATPALPEQVYRLGQVAPRPPGAPLLDGILITHAHMGHLVGLAHLGRESADVQGLPVYMPAGLVAVLEGAPFWRQLCAQGHLSLRPLQAGDAVALGGGVTATALAVPHRRELSETLAFVLRGPRGAALFVPDIDDWSLWGQDLGALLAEVDVAWLDGTFFAEGELARDMAAVPHPRVVDTLARLAGLPAALRARVRFTHLNHTNPLLQAKSKEEALVYAAGCAVAREGEVVPV